jgi:hypothetical protein
VNLKHFTKLEKLGSRPCVLSHGVRCLLTAGCLSTACTATEGPLFVVADASASSDAATKAPGMRDGAESDAGRTVRQEMRLQYQLQGALDLRADADLFVIDLFETEGSAIEQLHAYGHMVIAYVAAGTYEPWRPDVSSLSASDIGAPHARYSREAWLDVRASSVRQLMGGRLTLAAAKGFDGVLLASLDGYLAETSHDLTSDEQLDYNLWLAQQATERGLAVGISSDWAHAERLANHYDFAIHTNCLSSRRCTELAPYRARMRAVFDLETRPDVFTSCAEAARLDISVTYKRDTFDSWLDRCP